MIPARWLGKGGGSNLPAVRRSEGAIRSTPPIMGPTIIPLLKKFGARIMQSRRFSRWWFRTLISGRFFDKIFGWARPKKP